MRWRRAAGWATLAVSIVLLGVALAAPSLGVDSDQKWGPIRVGLLLVGSAGLLLSLSWRIVVALESRTVADAGSVGFSRRDAQTQTVHGIAPRFAVGVVLAASLVLYFFFVTAGLWSRWPTTTAYYDLLGQSLARGQTAIPIQPSPRLAELEDPYDPGARGEIPILFDASYFRGRYFFYWGPAPAVVAALWRGAIGSPIDDGQIAFLASSSVLVFSILIVMDLRKRFRGWVPTWLLLAGLIFVATVHPKLWVLNGPKIYEAAIAAGQAFLLAGLYVALPAIFGEQMRARRLVLVGLLWALAIGSRLTLVAPVAVLSLAVLLPASMAAARRREYATLTVRVLALLLPLVLGLASLGLYNFVRFGNPFETGLVYQLTPLDISTIVRRGTLFDLRYLFLNALYYLTSPLNFQAVFPFVGPLYRPLPHLASIVAGIGLPSAHHIENVTGLAFSAPAIFLAAFAIRGSLRFSGLQTSPEASPSDGGEIRGGRFGKGVLILFAAGIVASLPTAMYFWVSSRFLLESVPMLVLVAVVGSWYAFASSQGRPIRSAYLTGVLVAAVTLSCLASFLLAMTGAWAQFDDLNPALWDSLARLLGG